MQGSLSLLLIGCEKYFFREIARLFFRNNTLAISLEKNTNFFYIFLMLWNNWWAHSSLNVLLFLFIMIFLFDIIFLYYYFLSILTLFCDLCIAHTDFLFTFIRYILNQLIIVVGIWFTERIFFIHIFFMILQLFFICLHFFLHPLLGSTHPSGANCQTLRKQSCSIPNCNGWTKTKKIPQTYNSDNSSATGSWKRND